MFKSDQEIPLLKNAIYFVRWSAVSIIIGLITGCVGTVFGFGIAAATSFTRAHPQMVLCLPLLGLLILGVYHLLKEDKNRGTNMVIEAIYSDTEISFATAPAIFAGTILTHLGGGSAGREGAALQMGGSIGNQLAKLLRMDEKDKKIAVMCGMSGAFAALFGTPVAAAVFSMEVISIGVMYYAALVPCMFSAFVGAGLASFLGLAGESFPIGAVPALWPGPALSVVLLGIGCALVSELFCILLHRVSVLARWYLRSPYRRIAAGGLLIVLFTFLQGDLRYNGSGMELIEMCFAGEGRPADFLLKMIFTAVTLEAGFKGGEIVPTLSIGAAFGSLIALLSGQEPGLFTACGMLGLFVGVTNCPISTLLLGLELFGYAGMPYFALVIAVSFTLSGYYSLYASQKFVYSKTRTEYINRQRSS